LPKKSARLFLAHYKYHIPEFFATNNLTRFLYIPSQNNLDLGLAKLGIGMVLLKSQEDTGRAGQPQTKY
jgi:hypothetical protein